MIWGRSLLSAGSPPSSETHRQPAARARLSMARQSRSGRGLFTCWAGAFFRQNLQFSLQSQESERWSFSMASGGSKL